MARKRKEQPPEPSESGTTARDVEDARHFADRPGFQALAAGVMQEDKQSKQQLPKATPKRKPKAKPLPKPKP